MSYALQTSLMEHSGSPAIQTYSDPEVVELTLLVPRWQAQQLELAAEKRGMTAGQMLRRMISEMFVDHGHAQR